MSKEREALKLALEALKSNRQNHTYCEDTWYSCPKHEDGCANEAEGDKCNCGADDVNAQFDKAITAIKEALAQDALQALHDENKRLGLYEKGYADAMNWKVQNHLEHLPAKEKCTYPKCDYPCMNLPDCNQPEQEPVAWACKNRTLEFWTTSEYDAKRKAEKGYEVTPLYTTPPQEQRSCDMRTWVGLDPDEIRGISLASGESLFSAIMFTHDKLKEKNT